MDLHSLKLTIPGGGGENHINIRLVYFPLSLKLQEEVRERVLMVELS